MAKKNPNPSTKIVCPVCGTEFAIPEKTHVAVGIYSTPVFQTGGVRF